MNVSRRLALMIAGLGIAAAMGADPAGAQVSTSGAGPYYATPSWDQKIPAGRFVVLTNWNSEAVLDRETGLVWERAPDDTVPKRDWLTAQLHCANRVVSGRKGWKLPSVQELVSLVDPAVPLPGPALPPGHPFSNVFGARYWTSTTFGGDSTYAWWVEMSSGQAINFDSRSPIPNNKENPALVWCVRGGAGTDAQ